jgi:predicted nucleic acid-binding Zn ribbon protein
MTEQRLSDLIDPALRRMGIRAQVRDAQVQDAFADVVGAAMTPLCRAVSLRRGALLVATAHSALAHQLQLESPRIVAGVNARIGTDAVRRLAFTTLGAGDVTKW